MSILYSYSMVDLCFTNSYILSSKGVPVMTIQKIVGNNLKYYRFQSGLSQEKFYEKFGLSYKYLASVERGEVNITIEFLDKLAKLLKIDIREFLNPDETRYVTKKRIDEKEDNTILS